MNRVERRPDAYEVPPGFFEEVAESSLSKVIPILRPSHRLVISSVQRPSMVLRTLVLPVSSIFVRSKTICGEKHQGSVKNGLDSGTNFGLVTECNESDSVI
jgi:hypothetical protein